MRLRRCWRLGDVNLSVMPSFGSCHPERSEGSATSRFRDFKKTEHSALRACHFLLRAQEKVTKEKGTPS